MNMQIQSAPAVATVLGSSLPANAIIGEQAGLVARRPESLLVSLTVNNPDTGLRIVTGLLGRRNSNDFRIQPRSRGEELDRQRAEQIEAMRAELRLPADHDFSGVKCFNMRFPKGVPMVNISPALVAMTKRGFRLDDVYVLQRDIDGKTSMRFSFKERTTEYYSDDQLKFVARYLSKPVPHLYPHDNRSDHNNTLCLDGPYQQLSKAYAQYELHLVGDSYQYAVVPVVHND